MSQIKQTILDLAFKPIETQSVVVSEESKLYVTDPKELNITINEGVSAEIVTLCDGEQDSTLCFDLKRGAQLRLVTLHTCAGNSSVEVNLADDALYNGISIDLSGLESRYDINLKGHNGSCDIATLQLLTAEEKGSLRVNMNHLSADCTSRSLSKCVASGSANIHFDGLVYVAQDSQRTSADQSCRSIELSDGAHIVAQPQLEIYADDVKCSHGATVGQVDTEAILYMRQRGLSEAQARRVQMEGFVADIVDRCPSAEIINAIKVLVENKLEKC